MQTLKLVCIILLLPFSSTAVAHSSFTRADTPHAERISALDDSLMRQLGRELAKVTTEEVQKRKAVRRTFQRRGYQNVLMEFLRGDSVGSLLAFLKMNLHLEFFLPHGTIYIYQYFEKLYVSVPVVFRYEDGTELTFETKKVKLAIKEDWKLPSDPWKKEVD
jgi:hypothetical protein